MTLITNVNIGVRKHVGRRSR